jgi:glycosyltransferase involved in cell wall biosynthesis
VAHAPSRVHVARAPSPARCSAAERRHSLAHRGSEGWLSKTRRERQRRDTCRRLIYNPHVTLSVAIITKDEELNLPRTLESVQPLVRQLGGEIIIVDSSSTDRTLDIARQFGAKVFSEPWKGFAAQKNSAMDKATGDWILSLDADEPLETAAMNEIQTVLSGAPTPVGYFIPRKNYFLDRWIRHGGFYPDRKLRLIRRGAGQWIEHGAHPTIQVSGRTANLRHPILHYAYPNLRSYIAHVNSYSSMQAEHLTKSRRRSFDLVNIILNPVATFFYNYVIRLGFLDGREGLLLHLYHSAYVSWKYAKAWELSRSSRTDTRKP